MRICVIGTGYVGLVVGTCLAEMGHEVVCVENDRRKLESLRGGRIPIYEPGLEELVERNVREERLSFAEDLRGVVSRSEVVYIGVGTPQSETGAADLGTVKAVAAAIGEDLGSHYTVIVIKSTVPVGTAAEVREIIRDHAGEGAEFDVVSNPEFLKEGCAVDDFMKPDRIVVGTGSDRARKVMRFLYEPLVRTERPILFMDNRSAEMCKYASNAFLATKISFINEIANICERVGADIRDVRRGVGADQRIGFQFLFPGVGYGGSCFPKDVKALYHSAQTAGYQARLLAAVDAVNDDQKRLLGRKILEHFGGNLQGRTIAVWGLAFKPRTDDMREAPSRVLVKQLLDAGARVTVFDPVAMDEARAIFGDSVSYAGNAYGALEGADALALVTEWNEFRRPDFDRVARLMREKVIFDGRNIYDTEMLKKFGFVHYCIGKGAT